MVRQKYNYIERQSDRKKVSEKLVRKKDNKIEKW